MKQVPNSEIDYDLINKLQKELEKLESGYEMQKEKQSEVASKQVSLNFRNKLANTQNDILAAEKRKVKDDNIGTSGDSSMDPFRRRETLPQIIWNTSGIFKKADGIKDTPKTPIAAPSTPKSPKSPKSKGFEDHEYVYHGDDTDLNVVCKILLISNGLTISLFMCAFMKYKYYLYINIDHW